MQAVILAAGLGKRMLPLTESTPKPLLKVAGRPILEHIIEALPEEIDEIIFIVGYRADLIINHFGGDGLHEGRMYRFINQENAEGTYKAVKLAQPYLTGKFLLMNGDDLHGPEALAEAVSKDLSLLASRHEDPTRFGVLTVDDQNRIIKFVEKPEVPETDLVSTGAMVLDERVFNYEVATQNGEYFLTPAVAQLAQDHEVTLVVQPEWIPLGYPEDIANAELILEARKPEGELSDLSDAPIA